MSTPPHCPESACWQALLDVALPPDQRARYEGHLESCPVCQERLDRAEECGETLKRLAEQTGDPTLAPADPTLAQVLERLHEGKSTPRTTPEEYGRLDFLGPADHPDLLGTLGKYEVEQVLGAGGMGIVFRGFDRALDRLVAIKVLAPALAGSSTARRRFTREARAVAALSHEHVVAVHEVHDNDGLPYLVMQYVAGESLQARLDRAGPLELEEVVRIGQQTASGLAAAHARGLIHRDVKPANLLLEDGSDRVKITDFGLARMTDDVGLTQNGVVAGTPEYMAPEQARGEAVDHRADLFSLGSVLYALCTGVPPFRGETALAVLRQVREQVPTPLRERNPAVPAWLETLVDRLLAKDPADRWQSAAEVAALLEGYLAHLRQPASAAAPELRSAPLLTGAGRPMMQPRMTPRKWLLAAAGLVSLLGLLGVLGARLLTSGDTGAIGANQLSSNGPQSLEPKSGLVCLLVNKNSGRCLSTAGQSDTPGADVVQGPTPDRAGATECWALVGTGNAFQLRNERTHLVLQTNNANHQGARAVQARDQPTKPNQQWTFEPVGNGYLLRAGHSSLVLAIGASSREEGAKAIQWKHLPNAEDQLWELRPAPLPSGDAVVAKQPPARTELDREYSWSFKGAPEDRQHLEFIGPNAGQSVRFKPDGLRIQLPLGNPAEGFSTGLGVNLPVKGDFEITLNFEILQEPEPADAGKYGTALSLLVNLKKAQWTAAGCYRGVTVENGTQFSVWTTLWDEFARDGKTRDQAFPTRAKTGRLRLVRSGSRVSSFVSEGPSTDFTLLEESAFGDEDVEHIRITGCTGGPRAAFDARVTDLRIKTGSSVTVPAATRRQARTKPSLVAAALVGVGILSSLPIVLYVGRRRRAATKPAAAAAPNLPAEPVTATPVSFQGRGTSRGLRVRSALALPVLLLLAAVGLGIALVLQGASPPAAPLKEIYQDFRGSRPPLPEFTLDGGDADEVARPEDGGLRITMPATRRRTGPVGARAAFHIAGDFEITGTYELLSADPPHPGNGVGIALNVATDPELRNFAKLGRFLRVAEGSVFLVESWNKDRPGNYRAQGVPTEARTGQLRLVREGSTLRYLVTEGPGNDFRELQRAEFGTDELTLARFVVNNSGSPAGVDARLVDLKVRYGQMVAEPEVAVSRGWPAALEVLVLVLVLAALGGWLLLRRRGHVGKAPAPAAAADEPAREELAVLVSFRCAGCGKNLKTRTELAGKKVKCPQCGQAVRVPSIQAGGTAAGSL